MWRVNNRGENNPMYKGEGEGGAGYDAIHSWVRRRKPKPEVCERCKQVPPVDLANISGLYKREVSDYEYLCRKCHMDSDGRNSQLRQSGKSRKLPNKICAACHTEFHSDSRAAKYCGRKCWQTALLGHKTSEETKAKIRHSLTGHEVTQETRDKISRTKLRVTV